MKEYAAGIKVTELRLVDAPGSARSARPAVGPGEPSGEHHNPTGGGLRESGATNAAGTFAPSSGSVTGDGTVSRPIPDGAPAAAPKTSRAADKFLTAATKEFEAGIVDQPLWKRAVEQSGADRTLATHRYLLARATALRVTKREKREERSARRTRALNELAHPASEQPGAEGEARPKPDAPPRRGRLPRRGQVLWIGGALASLFAIALLGTLRSEGGSAQQRAAAKTPAAKRSNAQAAAASDGQRSSADVAAENLVERIPALKSAGNWNMVVLYSVEWIRKEPENPAAWRELATGYSKLRQYREALDAATRVVQLAPDDASAWQSLGQLNVLVQKPVDALAAFEQAIARNERDASSIVQMGLLNTQLGRFTDARLAFARALELDGHDVDALCGAAALAQKEGRAKDAEALTRQVSALDRRCRDPNQGESVRVAVGANAASAAAR
jgi:Flp pilus assembly protein TadD